MTRFHEKVVEPLAKAAHEAKGYAEGAAGVPPGQTAKSAFEHMGERIKEKAVETGQKILPESLQEKLGISEVSFGGRVLNFFERSILGRPLVFVAFPLILGLFISAWVHRRIRFNKAQLDKIALPNNVPPSWLYDPAWTIALTCMGYASWLIYEQGGWGEWLALGFYNMSLFLLAVWPVLFFHYSIDNQFLPAVCATLLSINTLITAGLFFSKNATAGALMIPAVLWIGYMTITNWQAVSLNRSMQKGVPSGLTAGQKGKEETWPWTAAQPSATVAATGASAEAKKTR